LRWLITLLLASAQFLLSVELLRSPFGHNNLGKGDLLGMGNLHKHFLDRGGFLLLDLLQLAHANSISVEDDAFGVSLIQLLVLLKSIVDHLRNGVHDLITSLLVGVL